MRTSVLAACLLPILLVTAAACAKSTDGKGVASVGGAATPGATPSLSLMEQGVRYARCMRQHGVPMPDPGPDGNLRKPVTGKDGIDPDVVRTAEEACKQYHPVGSGSDLTLKLGAERDYARCMRAHGAEDFPDPNPDGRFPLPSEQTDPDFDQAKAFCDAQTRSSRPSS
jgi:hypothetical protein